MRIKLIIFLLIVSTNVFANNKNIYGHILDKENRAIPYASIYLVSEPSEGTVSNNNGFFKLDADRISMSDTLTVSFIGFKTKQIPIKDLRLNEATRIVLVEELIMLDETTVFAKPIKSSKKRMKELLKQVKLQMERDFPDDKNRDYSIMSDYSIYNEDSAIITLEKAFGIITEIPNGSNDGTDSIVFKLTDSQSYIDPEMEETLKNISDNDNIQDKNKAAFESINRKTLPHQMLWGKDIKAFFDNFEDEKLRRWKLNHFDENTSILTYRERKNYIGIFTYELKLNFIIDKYTLSIKRLSQELNVKLNIPFGYKLSDEELEILNLVTLSEEKEEKFRVKRGKAHIIRDVTYGYIGKEKHPTEKSAIFDIQIQNRKRKAYKWNSATKINILEKL